MGFGGGFSGPKKPRLIVKEADGSPGVTKVRTIVVSNGTLTNDGGGQVTLTTGGGGGGGLTVVSGAHGQILRFHSGSTSVIGEDDLQFHNSTGLQVTGAFAVKGQINHSGNIIPEDNLQYNIGADDQRISDVYASNLYTGDLHMKNERGDWTIFEESNSLVAQNNLTGERFKLAMEKIED